MMKRLFFYAILLGAATLAGWKLEGQSPYSVNLFQAKVITATSTTTTAIALGSGTTVPKGGSYAGGSITLTGSSLTTATFGVTASFDNGVTYFAVPICTVAATPVCANTQTATANAVFTVNLGGVTHVKYVTSGTFTATSISLLLTASPNAVAGVGATGGSSGCANALTFAATGGAAPGSTFNCSAAVTIDYHSLGAAGLAAANLFTAVNSFPNITTTGAGQNTFGVNGNLFDTIVSGRPGSGGFSVNFDLSSNNNRLRMDYETIAAMGNQLTIGTTGSSPFILETNGTERARLYASGGFFIGATPADPGANNLSVQGGAILASAAPTVAAGQIGFGATTAAASNCNQAGVLTSVVACVVTNVAGTVHYLPYF